MMIHSNEAFTRAFHILEEARLTLDDLCVYADEAHAIDESDAEMIEGCLAQLCQIIDKVNDIGDRARSVEMETSIR